MSLDMLPDPAIDYLLEEMRKEQLARADREFLSGYKERLLPMSIIGPDPGRSLCDPWHEIRLDHQAGGEVVPPLYIEELLRSLGAGLSSPAEARRSLGLRELPAPEAPPAP